MEEGGERRGQTGVMWEGHDRDTSGFKRSPPAEECGGLWETARGTDTPEAPVGTQPCGRRALAQWDSCQTPDVYSHQLVLF